jgi:hypothetical protein
MTRVIQNYDPKDITQELIDGDSWDYIILNKTVNFEGMHLWWKEVDTRLRYLRFNITEQEHLIKKPESKNGEVGYTTNATQNRYHVNNQADHRLLSSYTLDWPVQRDIPLPPLWAADVNHFPELEKWINKDNKIVVDYDHFTEFVKLEQYMFGEFLNLYNDWGNKFLHNLRIQVHEPTMILPVHVDGMKTRLHIPLTYDNSSFFWGDCWNREYKLKVGHIYLINTHIPHSTTNFCPNVRANLISNIREENILDLISL